MQESVIALNDDFRPKFLYLNRTNSIKKYNESGFPLSEYFSLRPIHNEKILYFFSQQYQLSGLPVWMLRPSARVQTSWNRDLILSQVAGVALHSR